MVLQQIRAGVFMQSGPWQQWLENILLALVYWLVSHLAFLVFKQMGVLPMPIWPAAGLALVAAFFRGWRIAPGIALGTILANHYSLGGSWNYACCLALTNTLGPLVGAWMIRSRVSRQFTITGTADLSICLLAALLVTPMLTATGGAGFKWLLGLAPMEGLLILWLKWGIAHSIGDFLLAVPVFAWLATRNISP